MVALCPVPDGCVFRSTNASLLALFLCGKLYCLEGYKHDKPWGMEFDVILNECDSLSDLPRRPGPQDHIFSVAIGVVVGSSSSAN
uniref:Uncharacterized protein n=1 Tax=Quercus lobata TaxID=97700 RepID=A0A7N2L6G2_QUELO